MSHRSFSLGLLLAVCLSGMSCTTFAAAQAASTPTGPAAKPALPAPALTIAEQCKVAEAKQEPDPATRKALLQAATECVRAANRRAAALAARHQSAKPTDTAAAKALDKELETSTPADISAKLDRLNTAVSILNDTTAATQAAADSANEQAAHAEAAAKQAAAQVAQKVAAPTQQTPGLWLGQSAYRSTNVCSAGHAGSGVGGSPILQVSRQLLYPKDVADDFGRRLGKRFLVYQVTVLNDSTDFQFEVSDIQIDFKPILSKIGAKPIPVDEGGDPADARFHGASQDLALLRGVPEKGQDLDPRNLTLHVLQGIGSVAGGVSGLTAFSDTMGSAVANFNGAFLAGFIGIAPDHTATQLNRLSDKAFTANTLIERMQAKVFAVFVPEALVLDRDHQKEFWKNPRELLNGIQLDQLNVCVSGVLLSKADTTPDPAFSTSETLVPAGTTIGLSDSNAHATIYYTTDGTVPTTKSSTFGADTQIPLPAKGAGTLTLSAFALASGLAPSNVVVQNFAVADKAATPKIDTTKLPVTITGGANDTIYYTTDGTTPTRASKQYTAPIPAKAKDVIKAIAANPTSALSDTATATVP